jgi:hypothetical protein
MGVEIQLLVTGLAPPHVSASPQTVNGYPTQLVVVFIVPNGLRSEVFVRCGGIVGHHCLNFLFIIRARKMLAKII